MRWKDTEVGTERVSSGFLWFPKTINGETRWLEKATWWEEYTRSWVIEGLSVNNSYLSYCTWEGTKWLN